MFAKVQLETSERGIRNQLVTRLLIISLFLCLPGTAVLLIKYVFLSVGRISPSLSPGCRGGGDRDDRKFSTNKF